MRRLVELLALFSAFVTMSQAATIQVTSTVDGDGPGTLRDALRRASDGDVVELPPGAVFPMGTILDEAANFMGPTALPMIAADIVVEGRGARLERASDAPRFRAFAVAPSGHLTLRDVHVRGFAVSGGRGGLGGGGGGLGAGGAIYVQGGGLTVERCTFEGNRAAGGPGGSNTFFDAGGGAGLSGDGGTGLRAGGGGGGSRGHGGSGVLQGGGGGGGTLGFSGQGGNSAGFTGGAGGSACGGQGGDYPDVPGADGACPGGGGGGGSTITAGGAGAYGGGGGGAYDDPPGRGGFGGGGGAGGDVGADGGLGGGGGAGTLAGGRGGTDTVGFGGTGGHLTGGGGAGLGGAIFADGGAVVILDSTFTANAVAGGVAGTSSSRPETRPSTGGSGAGAAIFSRNGALTVLGSTIAGNTSSQVGGGIFVLEDGAPTSFVLRNTILAGNGDAECLVTGNIAHEGSGNLITANYGCSGVVSVEDPGLGPLRPNRPGSTPTMAIGPLSPAFDAGDDTSCRPSDQRGVVRPQVDHCDIGAFEVSRPVARCQDVVVSAGDGCMADASVDDGSFDPAGIVVTTTQDPPGPYPLGTTHVTLTASNEHGLSSTCTAAVTVRDATPPAIVTIGPVEILENNHKYRRFSVLDLVQSARDNCSSVSRLDAVIARATSDEPDDAPGSGDGSTRSDVAIGLGCKTVLLRQERDGGRDGRVYVSTVALEDAAGNVGRAQVIVTVPLGAAQRPAVDSGVALVVEGCAP